MAGTRAYSISVKYPIAISRQIVIKMARNLNKNLYGKNPPVECLVLLLCIAQLKVVHVFLLINAYATGEI